ncbi:MAG: carbon-nitrogen hydrolase, partial [Deltaproteobacteria bacterium]|nr:carbon-nitrogen hydrolase [Deltaproteobacteria bacterium]
VCLQELFRTIYFPQYESFDCAGLAESIPGESTTIFAEVARELGIVIIVPLFERDQSGDYFNSAAVIDVDGRLAGIYRKVHIPFDPLFYEKNYFKEGDGGFSVYDTKYGKVGLLICYDQWFPEAARCLTLMGADIIFYPTAIGNIEGHNPPEGDWHDTWETVQRGHAIANGIHIAAVNRVGREGRLSFWGGSFISDAFGNVIGRASRDEEEVLIVRADLSMNGRIREEWGFLRNRRPDAYRLLCGDEQDPSGNRKGGKE